MYAIRSYYAPAVTTSYTLTASNAQGTDVATTSVVVVVPPVVADLPRAVGVFRVDRTVAVVVQSVETGPVALAGGGRRSSSDIWR